MPNPSEGGGGGGSSSLPNDIIQSIAIANAKSIGEQPAILANLALSQQIFNQNLQQQMAIAQQQAMNQVALATAAKTVSCGANAQDVTQMLQSIDTNVTKILNKLGVH